MTVLDNWQLRDETGAWSLDVRCPFDAVSALVAAGHCPEPYDGANEAAVRWVAERDWTLSCEIADPGGATELVLTGLDGMVDVLVNGCHVLRADNAFRIWTVDMRDALQPGRNRIELCFRSVVKAAGERQAAQPVYIPYHEGNCQIPNINMLRKQQCDFGWDWNIALTPFGVSGQVQLRDPDAVRFEHIGLRQEHHDIETESVSLHVRAELANVADGAAVTLHFADRQRDATVHDGVAEATFFIEVPQFWWPAGQGAQPLYDLELSCGTAIAHRQIGLRRIEHICRPDDHGAGFKFRVNGRDVFAKGANWIPADALHGRIDRTAVRDLLQSAVDAHMNMIRVWGGGRYEPDWFYDLCDELGLMVWQDFMFACNLYPADLAFLDNVAQEAREQVSRLHHHACLALWCGDNEILGMLREFPEARANRDLYLVMYDRLNQTLERALRAVDPSANWWPSSPSLGPLNYGDAWHEDSSGDMHIWTVWHENKPFSDYREMAPRFVSEFGFQSYPSMEVIRRHIAPEDRNMSSPVMDAHQKDPGGNERIVATMMREFRLPGRFEDLVYLSQVQQGLAIKTAVSAWRALKGQCWGTLYWQLNDTWPCASWSSLNHGGSWKLLHHMAQKFYAPVFVTVAPDGFGDKFMIINDLPDYVNVSVQVAAVNMQGQMRPLADVQVSAWPSRALDLFELPHGTLEKDEIFVYTWQADQDGEKAGSPVPAGCAGGDFFAPKPWKEYDLLDPEISFNILEKDGVFEVVLEASALALFVTLEADQPGRFSGNAIMLLPGSLATLTFTPQTARGTPTFTIRNLFSATYGDAQ
nr:glycoside hydrolase family 2 protein [uncultured Celeribacter sp.]